MKNYTLDTNNINRVETHIQPPLRYAITIPVHLDGKDTGIAVYVAGSAFNDVPTRDDVLNIAHRLTIYSG